MATADCGCILTLYLILCRRCAPRSTNSTPATDEDVTLTKRTSAGNTQQVMLCVANTCPVTLTTPCGDGRGRVREFVTLVTYERSVTLLCTCHLYLAFKEKRIFDIIRSRRWGSAHRINACQRTPSRQKLFFAHRTPLSGHPYVCYLRDSPTSS